MKTTWILRVKRGYREVTFRFEDIKEAEAFMLTWMHHKDNNDRYEDNKQDMFSIVPEIDEKEYGDVED